MKGLVVMVALVTAAASVVSCVPDRPVRDPVDALIAGLPCPAGVRDQVDAWGGGARYVTGPSVRGGPAAYRVPGGAIGHWVVIDAGRDGSVMVSRWVDEFVGARVFDPDGCLSASASRTPGTQARTRASGGSVFTDADLREALDSEAIHGSEARAGHDAVVVYAWSPHMPLSVDGWAQITRAAGALGLRVVPVLIAGGNHDFASREAARVGMPEAGLREVASVELWMRDAQVHAPSILVFGRDRVSPVLPGYRNASAYRRYLDAFLGPG